MERLIKFVKMNVLNNNNLTFSNTFDFRNNFSNELQRFSIKKNANLDYGRYLVHEQKEFSIQLDVFSNNYEGSIHSHGTWGLVGILNGSLFIDDWQNDNGKFIQLRASYLSKGSNIIFFKESDWHKAKSPNNNELTLSIQIYGPNYDMDNGFKLDEEFNIVPYKRSSFKDISKVEDILIER